MAHVQAQVGGGGGGGRTTTSSSNVNKNPTSTPSKPTYSRPSSSHSSDSSDSAAQAYEAERKRRADEYKKLADGVWQVANDALEASAELKAAQKDLLASVTGALAYTINGIIEKAQNGIEKIVNDLNALGKKAVEKVQENGQVATYDSLTPDYNAIRNAGGDITFSCDTDALRSLVLPGFQRAEKKLASASSNSATLPKLEGCEDVAKVPTTIDDENDVIKNSYNEVNDMINLVEDAERKNVNIIGDLLNFVNGLLEPFSNDTTSTPTKTSSQSPTKTRTPTRTITKVGLTKEEKQEEIQSTNLQPKNNSDIAHRGYAPGGIAENTAEAYELAGQKGFWGCEADIRFDKNGNLVCSHNPVKNGETPTSFEEYLDICKKYGMTAIIDLKYEKGASQFDEYLSPAVLKVIEDKGMLDSCVIQTNNPNDIPYIRENSEDARIWYLTDSISDSSIKTVEDNNIECVNILTSAQKNSARINKLQENGIDVCVWNVQTEGSKEYILNLGATYIMSDNVLDITPYEEGETDFNEVKGNYVNVKLDSEQSIGISASETPTSTRTATRVATNSEYSKPSIQSTGATRTTSKTTATRTTTTATEDVFGLLYNLNEDRAQWENLLRDQATLEVIANQLNIDVEGKPTSTLAEEVENKIKMTKLIDRADKGTYNELVKEIKENVNDYIEHVNELTGSAVKGKWSDGYLTAAQGVIDYHTEDGEHFSETWCPLAVSQLVKNIRQYEGIYYEQWTREDGVQMYGPYVMVAADVKQREAWGGGREDATYSYGDIVETSLGTGIVIDLCGRSQNTRKATNGEQTHFDIYTKWWDGGQYQKVGYAEEYTPRSIAPSANEIANATYTDEQIKIKDDTQVKVPSTVQVEDVTEDQSAEEVTVVEETKVDKTTIIQPTRTTTATRTIASATTITQPTRTITRTATETPAVQITTEKSTDENYEEVPLYNQLDYGSTRYGNSTVRKSGCGIASLAMVLTYLKDEEIMPDQLASMYHRYKVDGGSSYNLFWDTADDWGVTVDTCYWGDAWQEGEVMKALENGQPIIANVHKDSVFTQGGHYIVLYGLTEDGKILVRDPNGANYDSQNPKLVDGFENGFDPDYFKRLNTTYFVYNEKSETQDVQPEGFATE